MDLALDNLQRLICHKIQPTNQPTNQSISLCLQPLPHGYKIKYTLEFHALVQTIRKLQVERVHQALRLPLVFSLQFSVQVSFWQSLHENSWNVDPNVFRQVTTLSYLNQSPTIVSLKSQTKTKETISVNDLQSSHFRNTGSRKIIASWTAMKQFTC